MSFGSVISYISFFTGIALFVSGMALLYTGGPASILLALGYLISVFGMFLYSVVK
jgi:hypothetical protein